MTRSKDSVWDSFSKTYIYLVKKYPSRHVLGVFTVKREMLDALKIMPNEMVEVWRYKDGLLNNPSLMKSNGRAGDLAEEL